MASKYDTSLSKDAVDRMSIQQLYDLQQYIHYCQLSRSFVAAAKVFAIPEVLENIFANPFFKDLFVVMRVDRTFRDVVASSLTLYRQLLFVYEADLKFCVDLKPTINPYLDHMLDDLGFELVYKRLEGLTLKLCFKRFDPLTYENLDELPSCEGKEIWRLTKITNYPVLTKLCLENGGGYNATKELKYYHLIGEEATLGRLWDLAFHIRKRSIINGDMLGRRVYRSFKAADYVPGANPPR